MGVVNILTIMLFHWLSDFVLQTDKQARNKSKSLLWLLAHVSVYSASMTCLLGLYNVHALDNWLSIASLLEFGAITFAAHFITDFFTSKLNSYLWEKGDVHNFFVSVGFDQLLHYIQLFLTIKLLALYGHLPLY